MSDKNKDKGIILALLDRFNKQRLPRALAMKEKVEQGEVLNKFDLQLIDEVFDDARNIKLLLERNPEYKELAAKAINLWHEIVAKNIENEKNNEGS
jgi:hypothetical protein